MEHTILTVPTNRAHLPYIDCIRGYAILMVITCHLANVFPDLPYPVHRVAVTGWFGVQLFFLASCITLLQSWASERRKFGRVSVETFFIRRFLRIAPAYYLASMLYRFLHPAIAGVDIWPAVASVTFVNALWPPWTLETNSLVPGGWSIGSEFAFYAVFPIFARYVTSLRRASFVAIAAILVGLVSNQIALMWFSDGLPPQQMAIGLFRWFPNECSVFALGAVAYFAIESHAAPWWAWMKRRASIVVVTALTVFVALAYVPLAPYIGAPELLPSTLCVSVVFAAAILALAAGPSIFVNPLAAWIGKVSFSAYLLHFAVLDLISAVPDVTGTHASGIAAIVAFAACWPATVLCTAALSWVSHRVVEVPMIEWGRSLANARRTALRSVQEKSI